MAEHDPEEGGEQSFLSHLIELRERLLKAVAAVLVILLALIPIANKLYGWLALPLIQHLPDHQEGSDAIPHRQSSPGREPSHPVTIEPGSLLARTIGSDRADVNSFHHQAIDRLGGDLVVTARAADGTIEAVEDPSRSFLIGVQWHAELMTEREEEDRLFRSFVEAAAGIGEPVGGRRAA